MKILVVSPYVPWPLHGGPSIRVFNTIKQLARLGHSVELLAGRKVQSPEAESVLGEYCDRITTYESPEISRPALMLKSMLSPKPYPGLMLQPPSLQTALRKILGSGGFDLVWVNFLLLADVVMGIAKADLPVVLDQHESEQLVYRDYLKTGTVWEKLFARMNLLKLGPVEERTFRRASAIFCVSELEAETTRGRDLSGTPVFCVPNGVDTDSIESVAYPGSGPRRIILCGHMGVRRNSDAAEWFARSVFPKVRLRLPTAEFWIVGAEPNKRVRVLANLDGVHVTGKVEDVREFYARSHVCVGPFRYGAGTKLKILESWALGIPVVATDIACRGLDIVPGRHALIARDEEDFARSVIAVLEDEAKARELAAAGREIVAANYSWKTIFDTLSPHLESMCSAGATVSTAP
jgi:glycosyltransferase involved in cell wall biosynthesis